MSGSALDRISWLVPALCIGAVMPLPAAAAEKAWAPIVVQNGKGPARNEAQVQRPIPDATATATAAPAQKPRPEPDPTATQAQLDALSRAKTPKEQLEALARSTAPRGKHAQTKGAAPNAAAANPAAARAAAVQGQAKVRPGPLNAGIISTLSKSNQATNSNARKGVRPGARVQAILPGRGQAATQAAAQSATRPPPELTPTERNQALPVEPDPDEADTADIVTGAVDTGEETRHLSPEDAARLSAVPPQLPARAEGPAIAPESDLARRYCVAIADTAADARIAWQKAKLAEVEQQIGKRIAALEAKTAEYKSWLERREEFSRRATETLRQIYSKMEPDAAAPQLVAMDEETAASILAKLDPHSTSAILNEMQPEKAARLAATIAGAARYMNSQVPPRPAGAAVPPNAGRPGAEAEMPNLPPRIANQSGRGQ
jgi:flagellar motility protein MotE (MotC chaperone)